MLRSVVVTLMFVVFPCLVSAETFSTDIGHDGRVDKVVVSKEGRSGVVEIYENGALAGNFTNLILDQTNISSDLVALTGGGLAIEVKSDGSRDKYRVIAPISKVDGKFYVDCLYKTVYDSVDETRSVGSSCKRVDLGKFDASIAIAEYGLMFYSGDQKWLKGIAPPSCANAVGLEYGKYRIVRCATEGVADTKNLKVMVFDARGALLFSVAGYELIPEGDGTGFVLSADLPDRVVNFEGNLACVSQDHATRKDISGKAKMAGRLEISYALANVDNCLVGDYAYAKKGVNIALMGANRGGLVYLLELASNKESTGLFVLDKIKAGMHGVWVGVPPKPPLSVN